MGKPSWKDAPDWAQWLAMARDGGWTWFPTEPYAIPEHGAWGVFSWLVLYAGHSDPSDDWQSTKERRPT